MLSNRIFFVLVVQIYIYVSRVSSTFETDYEHCYIVCESQLFIRQTQ